MPGGRLRAPMAYDGDAARYPLHAAAQDGRLAALGAELRAKQEEGSLAAGAPCRAPPSSPWWTCHARSGRGRRGEGRGVVAI